MLTAHVNAIAVNTNNGASHAFNSLVLITAFLPNIGYKGAEVLVKEYAETEGIDFHKFLKNKLGEELVERVLSPAALMSLGFKDTKDK
jgi:aspartate ammonia-lyase